MTGQMPTPAEVMIYLEDQAKLLDDLGKQLEDAHLALGEAEVKWEEERDEALLAIVDEYQEKGERMPAEDIRLAMARKRVGWEVYSTFRKADRLVKAIEGHVRRVEKAVNARQSTLKGMQEEARIPSNVDPETGEIIGARR